jgi:hypothetical protein
LEVIEMWKRISALFVLSVFLLSILPMAFAAGNEDAGQGSGEQAQAEVQALGEGETQAEVQTEAGDDNSTSDAPKVTTQTRIREKLQVRREEIKDKVVAARQTYVQAREHFLSVKQSYLNNRDKFLEARKNSLDCTDLEKEDCKVKREEVRGMAKDYLLKTSDLILGELERVKAKVQESEDLTDDEKSDLIADLDASIQGVQGAKSAIEGISENATREEINSATKGLREVWKDARATIKKSLGLGVNARLGNIILRTEKLEEKLQNISDRLESQGKDVSKLNDILDEFNAKIELARQKYDEARSKWTAAHSPQEVDDAAKEVHALLGEAKQALKDARDLLRDAVKEIKAQNRGSLEVESSETAEASA